jgi:lipoprotein-releasing system permease protein
MRRMNLEARLALSFIRRPGARVPGFTSLVSMVGVAVGVAAFVVVVTVFNSFERELKETLLGANPNLVVHDFPRPIPRVDEVVAQVKELLGPNLKAVSRFEYNESLLNLEDRSVTAVIKAIEGTRAASSRDLSQFIEPPSALGLLSGLHVRPGPSAEQQSAPLPPIILGKTLAGNLGARVGGHVFLNTGTFGFGSRNVYQKFAVVGLMKVGLAQYDEKVAFISFEDGVALFGQQGSARGIEVSLVDPDQAERLAAELDGKLPYKLRPWQEIDQSLFRQIERDGQSVRLIVLIITFVAAFNIIVTLTLSVVDRSRQIATLRSLGASRYEIIKVFLIVGGFLGLIGSALGIVLAVVLLQVFSRFELGELKAFYFVDRIPVHYDPMLMLAAFGAAVSLALVSALYPAFKATKVSPLVGLKPWQ